MRSSIRDASSQKSLSAQAWDGIIVFFYKTLIPLIPIIGIFVIAILIINAEVNGTYDGSARETGAIRLVVNEDNDLVTGALVLGTRVRYKIIEGKMLDDNKMQLLCQQDDEAAITGLTGSGTNSKSKEYKLPSESSIPANLTDASATQVDKAKPHLTIEGRASQGVLTGKMNIDGTIVPFEAHRNSFSSFFGWRWFNRMLRYVGIKNSS